MRELISILRFIGEIFAHNKNINMILKMSRAQSDSFKQVHKILSNQLQENTVILHQESHFYHAWLWIYNS